MSTFPANNGARGARITDFHACVSCGHLGEPRPLGLHGLHGVERECAACGNHCAVPLGQAADEGWLLVLDAEQRVLNERVNL